jgi:hypothetical protein
VLSVFLRFKLWWFLWYLHTCERHRLCIVSVLFPSTTQCCWIPVRVNPKTSYSSHRFVTCCQQVTLPIFLRWTESQFCLDYLIVNNIYIYIYTYYIHSPLVQYLVTGQVFCMNQYHYELWDLIQSDAPTYFVCRTFSNISIQIHVKHTTRVELKLSLWLRLVMHSKSMTPRKRSPADKISCNVQYCISDTLHQTGYFL